MYKSIIKGIAIHTIFAKIPIIMLTKATIINKNLISFPFNLKFENFKENIGMLLTIKSPNKTQIPLNTYVELKT